MIEIWGDEAGNLDFDETGSRLFIICTMSVFSRAAALVTDLLDLRRDLQAAGHELHEGFHATEDRQVVRDAVFGLLSRHDLRIDATIYTKNKVYPRIAANPEYFYKWAWFFHLRHALPRVVTSGDQAFVAVATLGVRRRRRAHAEAVRDVVKQCLSRGSRAECAYWSAASHPALQAADYCTWAVGRWKENGDARSYQIIRHLVSSCYTFV